MRSPRDRILVLEERTCPEEESLTLILSLSRKGEATICDERKTCAQPMPKHRLEADATTRLLAPLPIGRCNLAQKFKFIEAFACSFRDRAQRIFRNMDRQTSFLA